MQMRKQRGEAGGQRQCKIAGFRGQVVQDFFLAVRWRQRTRPIPSGTATRSGMKPHPHQPAQAVSGRHRYLVLRDLPLQCNLVVQSRGTVEMHANRPQCRQRHAGSQQTVQRPQNEMDAMNGNATKQQPPRHLHVEMHGVMIAGELGESPLIGKVKLAGRRSHPTGSVTADGRMTRPACHMSRDGYRLLKPEIDEVLGRLRLA